VLLEELGLLLLLLLLLVVIDSDRMKDDRIGRDVSE
jgi:hypothetical protein